MFKCDWLTWSGDHPRVWWFIFWNSINGSRVMLVGTHRLVNWVWSLVPPKVCTERIRDSVHSLCICPMHNKYFFTLSLSLSLSGIETHAFGCGVCESLRIGEWVETWSAFYRSQIRRYIHSHIWSGGSRIFQSLGGRGCLWIDVVWLTLYVFPISFLCGLCVSAANMV